MVTISKLLWLCVFSVLFFYLFGRGVKIPNVIVFLNFPKELQFYLFVAI